MESVTRDQFLYIPTYPAMHQHHKQGTTLTEWRLHYREMSVKIIEWYLSFGKNAKFTEKALGFYERNFCKPYLEV